MINSVTKQQALKLFRLANGLTQSQSAQLCRVSVRTFQHWEQDRTIPAGYLRLLELEIGQKDEKSLKKV